MKSLSPIFLIISTTVGFLLGWQLKTRDRSEAAVASAEESTSQSSRRGASAEDVINDATASSRQSSDTAADLHALPTKDLYERMALFLLEAEAGDFPAFYEEFKSRTDRTDDLNDLLFIAWTRVDPEGAIAASQGTDDFRYAYWAWACHDPGAALASAKERNEGIGNAALGIGEFHPEWLSEHWDEIPEDQRGNAIQGLAKWPDTETPEVTIRLILESKLGYYSGGNEQTLLAFARQDPIHAYEVLKELVGGSPDYQRDQTLDSLIASLSRYDPELLGEIATATKSPVDKNKIQFAQFKGLLRDDPESAKAMVESTPKGWLKEDLTIAYASHLLAADPERGFDYAVDSLKNDFTSGERYTWIQTENGNSTIGNSDPGSGQLISNLLNQDAPALMNELLPEAGSEGVSSAFQQAGYAWASRDVGAFAEWVEDHQDNPGVYGPGALAISMALGNKGEFEAGMEWAESIPVVEGITNYQMSNVYQSWLNSDPDSAVAWRTSVNFTGDPDQFPLPKTTESK